eukprot:SAG31_NODE_36432_length_313_cov_0.967290_1_plen_31_part_01
MVGAVAVVGIPAWHDAKAAAKCSQPIHVWEF